MKAGDILLDSFFKGQYIRLVQYNAKCDWWDFQMWSDGDWGEPVGWGAPNHSRSRTMIEKWAHPVGRLEALVVLGEKCGSTNQA